MSHITDPELLAQRRLKLIERKAKGLPFKDPKPVVIETGVASQVVTKIGEEIADLSPKKRAGRPTLKKEAEMNELREDIRKLLHDNRDKLQEWLEGVANKSPGRALAIYIDLAEYIIPRLQRSENKTDRAAPINVNFMTYNRNTLIQAQANPQQIKAYEQNGND